MPTFLLNLRLFDLDVNDQYHIVLDPCAIHGMPISKHTENTGRTRRHVKNPKYLTQRSKVNVVSGSFIVSLQQTHVLPIMVSQRQSKTRAFKGIPKDNVEIYCIIKYEVQVQHNILIHSQYIIHYTSHMEFIYQIE